MNNNEENLLDQSRFELILKNKITVVCCIILFIFAYILERFFTDLDEYFIKNILRSKSTAILFDYFWLIMFWFTVAIFFLSITVYFVFSNKRSKALAMLAIVLLGGLFLGDTLKIVFQLARPPQDFSNWVPAIYNNFIPTTSESHDFPAQSVLVPAAITVYFYLENPKRWKKIIFPIYVCIMFFTRPYIGVNHISASISGTILGVYIGLIVFRYSENGRHLSIFNKKYKKLIISFALFSLMFLIYTLERPLFYAKPSQGVDLDIRMFMIVLGGFIGVSINGPKELSFDFQILKHHFRYWISMTLCYIVMFVIYISALIVPTNYMFIGILLGFLDGLWISICSPKLVEYLNKNTILNQLIQ